MVINQRQLGKQKLNLQPVTLKPQGIFFICLPTSYFVIIFLWQPCSFQREVGKKGK